MEKTDKATYLPLIVSTSSISYLEKLEKVSSAQFAVFEKLNYKQIFEKERTFTEQAILSKKSHKDNLCSDTFDKGRQIFEKLSKMYQSK